MQRGEGKQHVPLPFFSAMRDRFGLEGGGINNGDCSARKGDTKHGLKNASKSSYIARREGEGHDMEIRFVRIDPAKKHIPAIGRDVRESN